MRISGRGFEGGVTVSQSEILAGLPGRGLRPTPKGMSFIAGIDLGTTNSLIGVMEAGFPILLADRDGERLTPSAVHFPPAGEPIVGGPALRMRAADPQHTVVSIKRFIGRRIGEER